MAGIYVHVQEVVLPSSDDSNNFYLVAISAE